jgi:thymidylate kinase
VESDGFYKVSDVRNAMAEYFDEPQKWLTSKWVGNTLRRLGFTEKRRVGKGVEYLLKVAQVKDLCERLGIESEEENEAVVIDMPTWIKAVYESFRKRYNQSFNNVEFFEFFVNKFGIPEKEATNFLKQLANDNLIFSTYQGVWVWT